MWDQHDLPLKTRGRRWFVIGLAAGLLRSAVALIGLLPEGHYFAKYPILGRELMTAPSGDPFGSSPFYIALNGLIWWLVGGEGQQGLDQTAFALRCLQGVAAGLLMALVVRRAFLISGRGAALAAIGLGLLTPSLWVHSLALLTAVWVLLGLMVWLEVRHRPVAGGLVTGLLITLRPVWALLALFDLWEMGRQKKFRRLAGYSLCLLVPVLPVLIFNAQRGAALDVTSSGPFLLYASHCSSARAWGYTPPSELVVRQSALEKTLRYPVEHRLARAITESEDPDSVYLDLTRRHIAADPWRFLRRSWYRLQGLWHPYVYHDSYPIRQQRSVPGLPVPWLLAFVWAGWGALDPERRRAHLVLLGTVICVSLVFYVSERLRLPLMIGLWLPAALGAASIWKQRRLRQLALPAAFLLLMWFLPNADQRYAVAVSDTLSDLRWKIDQAELHGRDAEVQQLREEMLEADPFNGRVLDSLGIPSRRRHPLIDWRPDELPDLEDPGDPAAVSFAHTYLIAVRRSDLALENAERAIAINPSEPRLWALLFQARVEQNDLAGARQAWERAVELGILLESGGRQVLEPVARRLFAVEQEG